MSRIETLKSMLADSPEDSFLRFAIAKEFEKAGDYPMTVEYYDWIVQHDPEYVGVYYHLASIQNILGQSHMALETYEKGIKVAKKLTDFHSLSELANAKQNLEIELGI